MRQGSIILIGPAGIEPALFGVPPALLDVLPKPDWLVGPHIMPQPANNAEDMNERTTEKS